MWFCAKSYQLFFHQQNSKFSSYLICNNVTHSHIYAIILISYWLKSQRKKERELIVLFYFRYVREPVRTLVCLGCVLLLFIFPLCIYIYMHTYILTGWLVGWSVGRLVDQIFDICLETDSEMWNLSSKEVWTHQFTDRHSKLIIHFCFFLNKKFVSS